MQVTGRIISICNPRNGTKKDGEPWNSADIVVEQNDKYKSKIVLTVFGEDAKNIHGKENNEAEIDFYISAREYNGRWYNDLKVKTITLPGVYSDEKPENDEKPDDLPS